MIDVGSANVRASELRSYASNLRSAYNLLEQYQTEIQINWQAQEVAFYVSAINNVQARLNSAAAELDSIASSVSSTASQIRAEEEAAERARREAEERARREAEEQARREAEAAAAAAAAAAQAEAEAAAAAVTKVTKAVLNSSSRYLSLK